MRKYFNLYKKSLYLDPNNPTIHCPETGNEERSVSLYLALIICNNILDVRHHSFLFHYFFVCIFKIFENNQQSNKTLNVRLNKQNPGFNNWLLLLPVNYLWVSIEAQPELPQICKNQSFAIIIKDFSRLLLLQSSPS